MKKKSGFLLMLLLAAALCLGGCQSGAKSEDTADKSAAEEEKSVKIYDTKAVFGEFTAESLAGEEVTQEIFADADLTMVNVWGTFCTPCIQEMPYLGELAEEYADKNVAFLGIVSDVYEPGDETAQQIIDETGADYLHVIHSEDLYNNFLRLVQVVPTTVFVDSNGMRVGDTLMGARDKESWIEEIELRLEAVANE